MEQFKLISNFIGKLKLAYPYYFKDLSKEEIVGLISIYQENLSCYNAETLANAINKIINTNKFMPAIAEIVEICEKSQIFKQNRIIELMKNDGYFKNGEYGELDLIQQDKNYTKTLMWVEKNCIPSWLKEDMKFYNLKLIENKNAKNPKQIEEMIL